MGSDERVVLFLKMKPNCELSDALLAAIRTRIRNDLSARHVPAVILPIADIPVRRCYGHEMWAAAGATARHTC